MASLDAVKSNKKKNKIKKTLGHIMVEDRKRYSKLQEVKSKTFNEALKNLNNTLRRSESLLQVNHYPQKIDISSILPKYEINYLKQIDYYKKWHFNNNILPIINKTKNNNQNKNNLNDKNKNKNNFNEKVNFTYLGSLYKPNKNSLIRNNKINNTNNINNNSKNHSQILDDIPFYLKGLLPRKNNIPASEIVKKSIIELTKKNGFKKYRYNMEEKVGNFVDYNDKFSDYYDFDKKVKQNIKDEMTGLSIPGNVVNRSCLGFIRTLQPKIVKIRVKKSVSVPEKTLLPVPTGLAGKGLNYTHITFKNVYNDKNKLI